MSFLVGATKPQDDLRRKAAGLIRSRLETLPVAQAAIDLAVSRQAIYDIKNDKYCPSLALVQRACEVWKLKFDFRGILIESESFAKKKSEADRAPGAQLNLELVEAIRHIDQSNFEVVRAKPMGRAVEITLRLTIPAGKAIGQ